jgi:HJR/Mrr/RecB family endonuclease
MSESDRVRNWAAEADSLAEFVEILESKYSGNEIDLSKVSQLLWGREVPAKRTAEILQEESKRLDAYESINISESSRAPRYVDLNDLELVSGYEFEHILAEILRRVDGDATVTEASGDQGVDVIWFRSDSTIGIQAKAYDKSNPVGNSAVQEIHTGVTVWESEYAIDSAAVVTTSRYTNGAKEAAESSDVQLYGRSDLDQWLAEADLDSETLGELLDKV